ncbi:hypothetical protein BGY98DRAFT_1099094 [Russula aff. rugulosa BPL654]|nr:hypothetical protein BGY98DRAFT_1099094 [Russula aff. rugulosa BPL654]
MFSVGFANFTSLYIKTPTPPRLPSMPPPRIRTTFYPAIVVSVLQHRQSSHTRRPSHQPIPGSSAAPQQPRKHMSSQNSEPFQHRILIPSSKSNLVHGPPQLRIFVYRQPYYKNSTQDEPTPDISIKVDPVPVTVTPSIIAYPPSVSVEQQDAHKRDDTTVSHARSDITLVSSDTTEIRPSISIAGVTLQASEELTGVPPTTVSDPQSSLIVALPSTSSVIPTEPPPSVESTLVQPDPLSHPFGSLPSTSTTTRDPDHLLQRRHLFVYNKQGHRLVRPDVGGRPHWPRNGTNRQSARDARAPKLPIPILSLPIVAPASLPERLTEGVVFQASLNLVLWEVLPLLLEYRSDSRTFFTPHARPK